MVKRTCESDDDVGYKTGLKFEGKERQPKLAVEGEIIVI